jgi:hypothetical protein
MDEIKRTFNVGDVIYWRWKGERIYSKKRIVIVDGDLISFDPIYSYSQSFIDTNEIDVA